MLSPSRDEKLLMKALGLTVNLIHEPEVRRTGWCMSKLQPAFVSVSVHDKQDEDSFLCMYGYKYCVFVWLP